MEHTMTHTWKEPMCLIESHGSGQLRVNDRTIAALSQVPGPMVVVGIVGLYRTGKSYLQNLLAGQTRGFSLGSTIQAWTKGIWVWSVPHPRRRDLTLLLMDTEGLGDTAKGDRNHDTWIFALTVLLSSTLVYNSKGTIDNDALEKLYFVTEIADHIKIKANGEDNELDFDKFFPTFIWAVRDFSLELSLDGRAISSDEYLESVLQLKKGIGKTVQSHNLPRECIRGYFRTRKCFTFPPPVSDSKMMKNLETLTEDQLDPSFTREAENMREYIYNQARAKMVNGHHAAGNMLGGLARAYVEAIMKGAVPCIENAVHATSNLENKRAVEDSVHLYIVRMGERVQLPTKSTMTLSAVHEECHREATATFLRFAIFDHEHKYQASLMEKLEEEYRKICHTNEQASFMKCKAILDELSRELNQKVASGVYMVPGGYQAYSADLSTIEQRYKATPGKGIKSVECLDEYLEDKRAVGCTILTADERITQEEKIKEEERQRTDAIERQRLVAEEQLQQTKQEMADRQRSYEDNIRQLQLKMEEEAKAAREEQEKVLAARLEEQAKLLNEGFEERGKDMQQDIDKLKEELIEAEKSADQQKKWETIASILKPIIGIIVSSGAAALTKQL